MGPRLLPLIRAALAVAAASSLSGCFLAVVGGAGEAGYVAAQEDRSAGQTVSDQWIHTKVKTELIAASGVPSGRIDVKVRRGVVTLKGVVDDADQKQKALQAARGVTGVKGVVDKLYVTR